MTRQAFAHFLAFFTGHSVTCVKYGRVHQFHRLHGCSA